MTSLLWSFDQPIAPAIISLQEPGPTIKIMLKLLLHSTLNQCFFFFFFLGGGGGGFNSGSFSGIFKYHLVQYGS